MKMLSIWCSLLRIYILEYAQDLCRDKLPFVLSRVCFPQIIFHWEILVQTGKLVFSVIYILVFPHPYWMLKRITTIFSAFAIALCFLVYFLERLVWRLYGVTRKEIDSAFDSQKRSIGESAKMNKMTSLEISRANSLLHRQPKMPHQKLKNGRPCSFPTTRTELYSIYSFQKDRETEEQRILDEIFSCLLKGIVDGCYDEVWCVFEFITKYFTNYRVQFHIAIMLCMAWLTRFSGLCLLF